jgi:hypothetical protein
MRDLVGRLKEAGISASFDAGEVDVPGVWLASQNVNVQTLDGGATHLVWAYLLAPDNGVDDAHAGLRKLLDEVLEVIDPDGPVTTNESVILPDNPTPLPAYRLPVELDV